MEVISINGRDRQPGHTVNTTGNTYDVMESLDADEVLHTVAAPGWYATFEDGTELPLVCWAIKESDRGHGVVISHIESEASVTIDASKDVSKQPGFTGYKKREV